MFPNDPLHVKTVKTVDIVAFENLPMSATMKNRWVKVRRWLSTKPIEVPRGRAVEATFTEAEIEQMLSAGHVKTIDAGAVKSTVNMFAVPEVMKRRRRVIKHTKEFNKVFGKDTLLGIKLASISSMARTVHDGKYAIHLDCVYGAHCAW
jgi:hypothetical protein